MLPSNQAKRHYAYTAAISDHNSKQQITHFKRNNLTKARTISNQAKN